MKLRKNALAALFAGLLALGGVACEGGTDEGGGGAETELEGGTENGGGLEENGGGLEENGGGLEEDGGGLEEDTGGDTGGETEDTEE